MKTTLQLDLHLDMSSVWRIFLQNLNFSGSGFFRISSLWDQVSSKSSGSCFFRIRFLQDFETSGSGFFGILRQHLLQEKLRFFNVSQHFEGSTFVVKLIIRDYLLCILNKHISPITVLSSNSKTSKGGHLMHLQSPPFW